MRVGGSDGGYCVALVHDLVGGEDLVAEMPVSDVPAARVRQVLRDDYRPDVGVGLGPAGVYGPDCRVCVRATQDCAVDESGQIDVGAVLGLAGDFVVAVVPDRPLAYGLVLGIGEDYVRRHLRALTSLISYWRLDCNTVAGRYPDMLSSYSVDSMPITTESNREPSWGRLFRSVPSWTNPRCLNMFRATSLYSGTSTQSR